MVEHKLIGGKWFVVEGLSILGINAKKVWLISFSILIEWKKAFTTLITEFPTRGQYFWKKNGGNPSGPGDLSGARSNVAALISIPETSLNKNSLSSWVMMGEIDSKSRVLSKWHDELEKNRAWNSLVMESEISVGNEIFLLSIVTYSLIWLQLRQIEAWVW